MVKKSITFYLIINIELDTVMQQEKKRPTNPFEQLQQKSMYYIKAQREMNVKPKKQQERDTIKNKLMGLGWFNNFFTEPQTRGRKIQQNQRTKIEQQKSIRKKQHTKVLDHQKAKKSIVTHQQKQIGKQIQTLDLIQEKQIPLIATYQIVKSSVLDQSESEVQDQIQKSQEQQYPFTTQKMTQTEEETRNQSVISTIYEIQQSKITNINELDQSFSSVRKLQKYLVQAIYSKQNQKYNLHYVNQQLKKITKFLNPNIFRLSNQQQPQQSITRQQNHLSYFEPQDTFRIIDHMLINNYQQAVLFTESLMNRQMSLKQLEIHTNILSELQKQVQEKEDSLSTVLLTLYQGAQNNKFPLYFTQQSTIQSQLSVKALSTGLLMNRIKVVQVLQKEDTEWSFKHFVDNKSIEQFQEWYKKRIYQMMGIEDIVIHQIRKCCIQVQWSTSEASKIKKIKRKLRMNLHPYFKHFKLSQQDFDQRGNISFPDQLGDSINIQRRGGYPYYQPRKCNRYGISVSKKFDQNDQWLTMFGQLGEWANAFHGVRYPQALCENNGLPVLNSIMNGMRQRQGILLKQGINQGAQGFDAVNRHQPIPSGVYCTPQIQMALTYSQSMQVPSTRKSYRLVFQCRVDPTQLYIAHQNNLYWIVKQPFIRPYGIILIKQQNLPQIKDTMKLYGQYFSYAKYQRQIQSYLSQLKKFNQTVQKQRHI